MVVAIVVIVFVIAVAIVVIVVVFVLGVAIVVLVVIWLLPLSGMRKDLARTAVCRISCARQNTSFPSRPKSAHRGPVSQPPEPTS